MSCLICQLFNQIETDYLKVSTFIFGILYLNACSLAFHPCWNPDLCTAKSHAGMMYSIQIKSLKCSLFKNLSIFFCLSLVSYFNNDLNNLTAFGLNKSLYDMFSPLPFETLLHKIMSMQMNKGLPCDLWHV